MSAEQDQIARLLVFADECVCAKLDQPLSEVHKIILEQALQGKKLKEIVVGRYSANVVERDFAPKLWKLLSLAIGQKVGIKNVRLLLEESWKKSQQAQLESTPELSFQPIRLSSQRSDGVSSINIVENLPAPTCTSFIGREAEIQRLLELLSPDHSAHLITVDGIGGVGKTSLVVECARRCLQSSRNLDRNSQIPTFAVILFVSAKLSHLESFGLIERLDPSRSLRDILQQIADQLDGVDLTGASLKAQVGMLKRALAQRSTLLIVDNLETVENPQEVIGFLYDLPASVKVIITTREQILFVPIRLTAMTEQDGLELIRYEAQEKGVALSPEDSQTLNQATGGIPVAVRYAIGQLANGYLIQDVLNGITQATGDVARFCFEHSIQPMRGQLAHQLLMALGLLPAPVLREALIQVALPDADLGTAQTALAQLRNLSLVSQVAHRYSMLPLTREYALAELKAYPDFAQEVRQHWIDWYLRFSQRYADRDAITWQAEFAGLGEEWQNIQAIADWCMVEHRTSEMLQLWRNLEPYTYAMGRERSRKAYWTDRLIWTEWLIQATSQRGDWVAATQVMLDRAWTLIAMRKPQLLPEAEQLLQQVWDLRQYQTRQFQLNLAKNMAVLRNEQNQFEQARSWLEQAEVLLAQLQLDESERLRQLIQIQYYRGMSYFKGNAISTAKQQFEEVREQAFSIGWERAVRMAENWLADIAIVEGNFDQAELWLKEGLRLAELNNDLPQVAFSKRSLARFYQAQGNRLAARNAAGEALEIFSSLEILHQAEETQALIDHLQDSD